MRYLTVIILLVSCASRPDAITGVTVNDVPRSVVAHGAEAAAMCLGLGFELPPDPFAGIRVVYGATAHNYLDTISVPTDLPDYELEQILAHEFIHVALTRYRPHVASHHQWMEQAGVCFGGCMSMPTGRYNKGCE